MILKFRIYIFKASFDPLQEWILCLVVILTGTTCQKFSLNRMHFKFMKYYRSDWKHLIISQRSSLILFLIINCKLFFRSNNKTRERL